MHTSHFSQFSFGCKHPTWFIYKQYKTISQFLVFFCRNIHSPSLNPVCLQSQCLHENLALKTSYFKCYHYRIFLKNIYIYIYTAPVYFLFMFVPIKSVRDHTNLPSLSTLSCYVRVVIDYGHSYLCVVDPCAEIQFLQCSKLTVGCFLTFVIFSIIKIT